MQVCKLTGPDRAKMNQSKDIVKLHNHSPLLNMTTRKRQFVCQNWLELEYVLDTINWPRITIFKETNTISVNTIEYGTIIIKLRGKPDQLSKKSQSKCQLRAQRVSHR